MCRGHSHVACEILYPLRLNVHALANGGQHEHELQERQRHLASAMAAKANPRRPQSANCK
eukprot:14614204-Alexandrium_andersonii.AAC.1